MEKERICILGSCIIIFLMVNAAVAQITTFTVSTVTPDLTFSGNREAKWVNATGVPAGTAWGNITNTGDVSQTFKITVDMTFTGIELLFNNIDSSVGKTVVGTTPVAWQGSSNVPASGTVDMYVRANFSAVDSSYTQGLAVSNG